MLGDIGVAFDARTGRAVVVSAIDNLVKGAAGQAIGSRVFASSFGTLLWRKSSSPSMASPGYFLRYASVSACVLKLSIK